MTPTSDKTATLSHDFTKLSDTELLNSDLNTYIKKWTCRSCGSVYTKRTTTCATCGLTRNDMHNIFICPRCKTSYTASTNSDEKRVKCPACGQRKRSHVTAINMMSRNELAYRISNMRLNRPDVKHHNKAPLKYQALVAFLYLSGARVSEVVNVVRKRDVQMQTVGKHSFMFVMGLPTLKKRKRTSRSIPIFVDAEKDILKYVVDYLDSVKDESAILWPFSRGAAKMVLQFYFKQSKDDVYSPHYFRHLRATHLIQYYNFDAHKLQMFFDWSTISMAVVYSHLQPSELARSMVKGNQDVGGDD